jgi:hypothetical protein
MIQLPLENRERVAIHFSPEDLDIPENNRLYLRYSGSGPNRRLVVSRKRMPFSPQGYVEDVAKIIAARMGLDLAGKIVLQVDKSPFNLRRDNLYVSDHPPQRVEASQPVPEPVPVPVSEPVAEPEPEPENTFFDKPPASFYRRKHRVHRHTGSSAFDSATVTRLNRQRTK